jgi:hypothetical protein
LIDERIVRNVWMSAALLLGFAGCKPEPPDDNDAGVGGSAMGGTAAGGSGTGGSATGGTAAVCTGATVASLPVMNTACDTEGQLLCDATGDRCSCQRGHWYCTTLCASTYPTEPAPGSACTEGAICNYPSGVSCTCSDSLWWCIGTSDCPADVPSPGAACDGLSGRQCDYPNSSAHPWCLCAPNPEPSPGSAWLCMLSGPCPTAQPPYGALCYTDYTTCTYGSTRCNCTQSGYPWVCGLGVPWAAWMIPGWSEGGGPAACGSRNCSTENVLVFSCQGELCTSTCRPGWLNVNLPASGPDDGCETIDLNTNIENCGAIGRSCSTENVAAFLCQDGVCKSLCRTGWLNVSLPASGLDDGCETPVQP